MQCFAVGSLLSVSPRFSAHVPTVAEEGIELPHCSLEFLSPVDSSLRYRLLRCPPVYPQLEIQAR